MDYQDPKDRMFISIPSDDGPAPWERQAWHTDTSYAAFRDYYLPQSRPRGLTAAYRDKQGKSEHASGAPVFASAWWHNWSKGRDQKGNPVQGALTWEQRADAYDQHLRDVEDSTWVQRRIDLREAEAKKSSQLLILAERILTEAPNFIKSKRKLIKASKPGDNDLEVVTLELDIDAAFKAIKLASELGRLSADMHTKKEQVDLTWDDIVPPSMDPDAAARHFAQILLGRIQNRGNRSGND